MHNADSWFMCRLGLLETARAVGLAAGGDTIEKVLEEWSAIGVIEVDQALVESAISLALEHELRSLDSLHLAASLLLPNEDLVLATWDRRLHEAASVEGVRLVPEQLE